MSCPADMAARVGAPHYRNTQSRMWSYLGAGCWLRTILSLIWLCIGVVRRRGDQRRYTHSAARNPFPVPGNEWKYKEACAHCLNLHPCTLTSPEALVLPYTQIDTHTHTNTTFSCMRSRLLSSIWFPFSPENQNNRRRRRSWQLRRFTEWQNVRGWESQRFFFPHSWCSCRVTCITHFTPDTLCGRGSNLSTHPETRSSQHLGSNVHNRLSRGKGSRGAAGI